MLTLLSEVKFLTTRDDINIKDTDFGAFKYTEKKMVTTTNHCVDGKQEYAHFRDQEYILHGRKTKQLKSSLKKLEDMLKCHRIVYCTWTDNAIITILLSNGLLVHICINIFTGDINRMAFDRFFIGKLISESVTNVVMTRMHILISYDINQLTFVYLHKPNLKKNAPEKISRMDPKIFHIIISGTHTKKIARHLACNMSSDLLAVWTKSSQNEVYPWRPTVRDQDRANIHIYRLSLNKLDLLCFHWTENDPINVEFSKLNQNQLRSVEQKMSRKGEVTIEICVYEVNKSKISRISITSIPLHSQVCCHSFSPDNEKLMLGCIDASIILFDESRGITFSIKAAFIPTMVSFHADSAILMIANEKCQIQCFDISLSCIRNQILNEEMTSVSVLDLTGYFMAQQPMLLQMLCSRKPEMVQYNENYIQSDSYILLLFENGPITILRLFGGSGLKGDFHTSGFTADVLIQQYLKLNSVEKAINVLLCLNWDVYGAMLMISLHKIANYILRQPFQEEREAQLTKALGSFLVPVKPLCEETQTEFGDQVRDVTRKMFQYLLRNGSYENAFNLAIDIDDEDIFMDLSNCAKEDGNLELAQDAFRKAEQIIARPDSRQSSHSTCSRDSCSICMATSAADDESEAEISWKGESQRKKTYKSIAPSKIVQKEETMYVAAFSIPKPELKVSNYSKNTILKTPQPTSGHVNSSRTSSEILNYSSVKNCKISRSKSEVDSIVENSSSDILAKLNAKSGLSDDQVDHINSTKTPDRLKYQQHEKGQKNSIQILQSIPQHHHVVDIVPKPKQLTQEIGIPIASISNMHVNALPNKPWNMHNFSGHFPTIIHHPLVSGHIPLSYQAPENRKKMPLPLPMVVPLEQAHLHPTNIYSSILSSASQQQQQQSTSNLKRENGEKNKVKFSNTVTVAVVPEIPRREKSSVDRTRRSNNMSFVQPLNREVYLKDFTSIRLQNDSSTSKAPNSLTWV